MIRFFIACAAAFGVWLLVHAYITHQGVTASGHSVTWAVLLATAVGLVTYGKMRK
jgi:hypothetical protein